LSAANPAVLSDAVRGLFPDGTVAAEMREPGDPSRLLPEEAACLTSGAVEKRRREFAAGRLCARRAMAELGVHDFALRVGADRQPLWPDSLVGSITHTGGLCAAVVAPKTSLAAVGLDSEVVGSVAPDLWPTICLPVELGWLESLPAAQRAAAVTLIFSAKEAFYKCQYPVTAEWLNFDDLQVEPLEWGPSAGAMQIRARRSLRIGDRVTLPVFGQYVFHEDFVTAGVALSRLYRRAGP
jgi:4'-phosphopantetheinyl transferase EntD